MATKYQVPYKLRDLFDALEVGGEFDGEFVFPGVTDEPIRGKVLGIVDRPDGGKDYTVALAYFGVKISERVYACMGAR